MEAQEVIEIIGPFVKDVRTDKQQIFATLSVQDYRGVFRLLSEKGVVHVSDIAGVDLGDSIAVIYRFGCRPAFLNLKILLPKSDPRIHTITDIFPGASLYERDLMEMLGVRVEGHPDPRRLFLPDDWPEGVYPLRKEAKP
ncbi:MAG: NADH-quinone oxidoreductase subunit C [Candidatus Hadarchaeales archaeon]